MSLAVNISFLSFTFNSLSIRMSQTNDIKMLLEIFVKLFLNDF